MALETNMSARSNYLGRIDREYDLRVPAISRFVFQPALTLTDQILYENGNIQISVIGEQFGSYDL